MAPWAGRNAGSMAPTPDMPDSGMPQLRTLRPLQAILLGTLIVGVVDGLDAVIFSWLRSGVAPTRIFQFIASGLLGPRAFSGGSTTAAIGLLLHFVVACGIVSAYVLASLKIRALRDRPLLWGPIYGVAAYLAMNFVVVPQSAIGGVSFNTVGVINGVLIHIFGVGLPAALVAARVRDTSTSNSYA